MEVSRDLSLEEVLAKLLRHAMTLWTLIRETVGCSRCQAEARRVADVSPGRVPESDDSDEEV